LVVVVEHAGLRDHLLVGLGAAAQQQQQARQELLGKGTQGAMGILPLLTGQVAAVAQVPLVLMGRLRLQVTAAMVLPRQLQVLLLPMQGVVLAAIMVRPQLLPARAGQAAAVAPA
jgi:hypothetical protein